VLEPGSQRVKWHKTRGKSPLGCGRLKGKRKDWCWKNLQIQWACETKRESSKAIEKKRYVKRGVGCETTDTSRKWGREKKIEKTRKASWGTRKTNLRGKKLGLEGKQTNKKKKMAVWLDWNLKGAGVRTYEGRWARRGK